MLVEDRAEIGASGLQSPWSSWVMAGLPLQVSAAPSSGAAPLSSSLTLTASDPSGQPLTYSVAFGDGQSAAGTISSPYAPITINHTYTTPGTTYTVGASITDTSGVTGSAFTQVTTTGTNPPHANAGESQVAAVGVPATLNGSGSQPAASITSYAWSFGDGSTGSGESVQHTYTAPGNYTATLTVANAAHLQSVSQTQVTVVAAPTGTQGLSVTVTDGTNPISGASLAVVTPNGTRYPATSNAAGMGVIAGLPDGTYTVYVYQPGYLPGTVTATQTGGTGSATIALQAGSISQTSSTSTPLTYDQILADGLNPNDPANQNVFKFSINLAFFAGSSSENVQVSGDDTGSGIWAPSVTGSGGGGGGIGSGNDGGGGGGGGCTGCVSFSVEGYQVVGEPIETTGPNPEPALMWIVIPGQAQWLKEFFDVKMIVSNLAPSPFTFDNGTITLGALPNGLSLAPVNPAPSITHSVADIPAGGSVSSDWVLRGDAEGYYGVSATYSGTLDPGSLATLSFPIATAPGAIHVWGGSALHMYVDADATATKGKPYLVRVGLTNVSDIPIYDAGIQLFTQGSSGYIYQPGQQLSYGTAVIEPGATFWTPYYRLIPIANGAGPLNLNNSFVAQTGGNATVPSTIESHPAATSVPTLTATSTSTGVHLSWSAPSVSGITGYKIYYTPNRTTPFGPTAVKSASASATSATIANGASGIYAVSTQTADGQTLYNTVAAAPARHTLAKITVTPTTINGTGTVTIKGSGYGSGTVHLYADSTAKSIGTATASSSGAFTATVAISGLTGGAHTLIAVGADGSTATATLTVTAKLTLSATSGRTGRERDRQGRRVPGG